MMEYLGRPFGMSNKPHSKILLNTASFYLRGRLGGKICSGILDMLGMRIYRCLTFKEMFQGAHSTDMQNRGLLIQLLLKPTNPFFKISLRNVGNLGGGGHERGRGESWRRSKMCEIQVINLWMRETRLCVVEKTAG